MLMQEVDQSMAQQRNLVTMVQKLDSEVALLEQSPVSGPGSSPPITTAGVSTAPTKSPRSGRKRRGSRRNQQSSDRMTTPAASAVKDVVVSMPDQRACVPSNLPAHSAPLPNPAGFMPPFSCAPPGHAVAGFRAGLMMAPMTGTSIGGAMMPGVRFVNGDDGPIRFPKHAAPAAGVATLRLPRGRQDSSSSTDSAETVRHLEHGTCVGDVDRYLTASAMMQSAAGAGPVEKTSGGAFVAPSAVSSAQGMRFYFRPALLPGVSFPASRSELEQYKQVVHGSAHVPPTDASTASTPKSQGVRQRSPGRGRGRKPAAGRDQNVSRNVVVPVATTSSVSRFFSVGMVPQSVSMHAVRGVAHPYITAVHGMLRLTIDTAVCSLGCTPVLQCLGQLSLALCLER